MKTLDPEGLAGVEGLVRCEEYDRDALGEHVTECRARALLGLAGFSHAGDYAAAAVVRWHAVPTDA